METHGFTDAGILCGTLSVGVAHWAASLEDMDRLHVGLGPSLSD